jgi:hypothetical protein
MDDSRPHESVPQPSLWPHRGLWLIVGTFGVLILSIVESDYANANSINWFGLSVGVILERPNKT